MRKNTEEYGDNSNNGQSNLNREESLIVLD